MTNEREKIAEQIKTLVDQLAAMSTRQPATKRVSKRGGDGANKKGAAGGISILIREGFFDKPQDLSSVMAGLEKTGRYYAKSTVSMNLLNLKKRRIFNRIKNGKTKNWQYVLRK